MDTFSGAGVTEFQVNMTKMIKKGENEGRDDMMGKTDYCVENSDIFSL